MRGDKGRGQRSGGGLSAAGVGQSSLEKGLNTILFKEKREKRMIKTHFNGQEVEATFIGQGLGYHGLGASGRSVEQNAFGREDPHAGEGLGMPQGPLHGLLQFQLHFFHAGYVRPADLKRKNF